MAMYGFALLWGLLILAAWTGWGGLLELAMFRRRLSGWALRATWGIAFSIVVGGALNLAGAISRRTVYLYLAAGALAWVATLKRSKTNGRLRSCRVPIALVVVLAASLYAGTATVTRVDNPSGPAGAMRFNTADDCQAYLLFPEEMLQLGSLANDPFSARRIESALGGQSFLDALALAALAPENLHLIDPGLGLLILLGLLWELGRMQDTPPLWTAAVMLLLVLLDPPTINVSSLYTGAALFLGLYLTLLLPELEEAHAGARIMLPGMLGAAIVASKSTLIPAVAAMLAFSFICWIAGKRFDARAVGVTVATAAATGLMALPWMISLLHSSGTLLYPVLGHGDHQVFHWLTPTAAITLLVKHQIDAMVLAFTALAIGWLLTGTEQRTAGRAALAALLVGAGAGYVAVTLATGDPDAWMSRYSHPFLLAAILALLIELLRRHMAPQGRTDWRVITAAAVGLFLAGTSWEPSRILYEGAWSGAKAAVEGEHLSTPKDVAAYSALQNSVPPGEKILARLYRPFLLDLKRNPIYSVDYAVTSPPPGMPLHEGGAALADYLHRQSIRYVAYSYRDEAQWRSVPVFSPFMEFQLRSTFAFEDRVDELSRTHKRIYDDGVSFVLDLDQAAGGPAQ